MLMPVSVFLGLYDCYYKESIYTLSLLKWKIKFL